jgi:hypothetical protein
MKYYCKKQDVTVEVAEDLANLPPACLCGYCGCNGIRAIPEYETVAQWEARTGRTYPDTAPVYAWEFRCATWFLLLSEYSDDCDFKIVATDAGAPPEGWRPEETA